MPLVLAAILAFLLLISLLVGALVSMGLGLGLAIHPRTRWVTPIFTLVIPLALVGAFIGAWYLPQIFSSPFLDIALRLVIGGAFGFLVGGLLASASWFLVWWTRPNKAMYLSGQAPGGRQSIGSR